MFALVDAVATHRYWSVVKSGKRSAQEWLYSHCAIVIADHEFREQDLGPALVCNGDTSVIHAAHRFGTLQMVPELAVREGGRTGIPSVPQIAIISTSRSREPRPAQ